MQSTFMPPSESDLKELRTKYEKAGQEQVFAFYDHLKPDEQATLYDQLESIDPEYINTIAERALHPPQTESDNDKPKLEQLPGAH